MFQCLKRSYRHSFFPHDFFLFLSYTSVLWDYVYCAIVPNVAVFHIPLQADDQSQMSHALEEIPARFPELPSTYRQL
jgi:hypothetical protein